jgi:tripartite-type tricarboxylate transporter receptor subunit TctC
MISLIRPRSILTIGAVLAAVAAVVTRPAAAEDVAAFYKGKTVTILAAHESGTGFDIYARALQRHLQRHIPGNPTVLVQNMPGAGGVVGLNWLYNIAPKDGTTIGTFVFTAPFEPLMGNKAARFDPAKFGWIGNMEEGVAVCGVSKAAGVDKFEDMRSKEVIIGASGQGSALVKSTIAVRNLFDVKMKLVAGYKGTASIKIAMARGEVHGVCSLLMSTVRSHWRDDYESGNFRPILQLSGRARLDGVAHVDDFVKTDADRQVHALIFGIQSLGKMYAAPPGIPADRLDALRKALAATMKDAEFLAEAAKMQLDISPMTGDEVEAVIAKVSAASPDAIERAKQALTP